VVNQRTFDIIPPKGCKRCIQVSDSAKQLSFPFEWILNGVVEFNWRVLTGYFRVKKPTL
jgi:hypothetical protein